MNERIKELEKQAWDYAYDHETVKGNVANGGFINMNFSDAFSEKFAELIVEDACRALNPMLRDMISRGQAVDLIRKHFEQRPGWVCPKCGVDRAQDVCPKGHTAAITGECPMTASAQTGE